MPLLCVYFCANVSLLPHTFRNGSTYSVFVPNSARFDAQAFAWAKMVVPRTVPIHGGLHLFDHLLFSRESS